MVHWSNPTIRMIHLVGSVVDRTWDLGNILIEQTRSMILRFACTYMWVFGFTRLERIPWSIPNPLVGSMSKISNAKDYNSMYIDTRPNFSFFFESGLIFIYFLYFILAIMTLIRVWRDICGATFPQKAHGTWKHYSTILKVPHFWRSFFHEETNELTSLRFH